MRSFLSLDCEGRIRYSMWFQDSVFNGLLDPKHTFYSDEAWFILSGYVNSPNNRYWSTENLLPVREVLYAM
jgi:hypothetical protein